MMTACALGLLCLPQSLTDLAWWPAVSGALIALFWPISEWFRPTLPERNRTSSTNQAVTIAASALAMLVIFCSKPSTSWSGGPEPFTVLLLPADETKPAMALAPPELLRQLEQKLKSASPTSRPIVLVSGSYTARGQENKIELEARYDLYNFVDKADLLLPLSGVDLKEGAFLDGAPPFPR